MGDDEGMLARLHVLPSDTSITISAREGVSFVHESSTLYCAWFATLVNINTKLLNIRLYYYLQHEIN